MRCGSANNPRVEAARRLSGFTLVELMAAGAVFLLILALTLTLISFLTRSITQGASSLSTFQEARSAFETMNRILSQAVLNTYWDYDDPAAPANYLRASELHFVLGSSASLTGLTDTAGSAIFFQAPLSHVRQPTWKSQSDLLNTVGFYVRYSSSADLPEFLADKKPQSAAWRLWMFLQPADDLSVYETFSGRPQAGTDFSWFQGALTDLSHSHVLANNIILLLIRAGYAGADGQRKERYVYNSRGISETSLFPQAVEVHQLPPELLVTLVAIDQRTADRLRERSGNSAYQLLPPDLFLNAAEYQSDLRSLEEHINDRPLGGIPVAFRIFETAVNVSSSKWSR